MLISLLSNRIKNTAWWTADFSSLTGQAIVTSRVVKIISDNGGEGVTYQIGNFMTFLSWIKAVYKLWSFVFIKNIDQIYIVCSRSTLGFIRDLPAYILIFFGKKIIVHTHGSDVIDLCKRPFFGDIARFFLSNSGLIIPSKHLYEPLKLMGAKNISLCENFYEHSSDSALLRNNVFKNKEIKYLIYWNSNIMASKGFFKVAEAVKLLTQNGHEIGMISIGRCISDDAMSESECNKFLQLLRTEPWFIYLGPVSRERSAELLNVADIICFPSIYSSECQPLAIIEAMCSAKSIIIADTAALLATVQNYPCKKIKTPVNINLLADLILKALNDLDSSKLKNAANDACVRFSLDRFDQDIINILALHK